MKRRVVLFAVCLCSLMAWGQTDYYVHFQELLDKEDTVGLRTFIPEWEQKVGLSGDTYAAWYNLLVLEGTIADLQLIADTTAVAGLLMRDSLGNIVGTITGEPLYDSEKLGQAYQKIDEGIAKYPDRLDLWFGKAHVQQLQNDDIAALETLKKVIDRSLVNHQQWLWTNDKPTPSAPKDFFFDSLQGYFSYFHDAQSDSVAQALVEYGLKYYPDNIYLLNDKAVLLTNAKKLDEALNIFLKLYNLAPNDEIVVWNIASLYAEKHDKKQAEIYYKKLLKSKDRRRRKFAKQELKRKW